MDNEKRITIETYDKIAEKFDLVTNNLSPAHTDLFIESIIGKKILDVGSGPGRDASYFQLNGFNVTCIDLSDSMIELCKNKGLNAIKMDLEKIIFPDQSFDGVWANTSLIHIPKNHFPSALDGLYRVLKPDGILGLSMKNGSSEGFKKSKWYGDKERFYALYSNDELTALLEKHHFKLFYNSAGNEHYEGGNSYLNYLCKKPSLK
ncbi:MAG: class I SAM-dependent methyltransferase [Candidatus Nanoarchaeia archaeon]|jgi:ubiquinone/menaquinone biosynthesis C-methylase UbiE